MRVTIIGTGNVARSLGRAWTDVGHRVAVVSRRPERAQALVDRLGPSATVAGRGWTAGAGDAVLLAVPWDAVPEAVATAGGGLAGVPLIDPTNPVRHGVGEHLMASGTSAAQHIARLVPGARVVKAFQLFPADHWLSPAVGWTTVPLCGDDSQALGTVATLVTDIGATPVRLGPLSRARQLEEAAGFVIGLAFQGADPAAAVPRVGPHRRPGEAVPRRR